MTRHSRAVALAAALLYAGFVVTQVAAVEDTEPSFRIEEAELDLGTIVAGTTRNRNICVPQRWSGRRPHHPRKAFLRLHSGRVRLGHPGRWVGKADRKHADRAPSGPTDHEVDRGPN